MATEMKCPPMTGQGWAMGLFGAAKSNTAEAPMDAIISGRPKPSTKWLLTRPTTSMAIKAATLVRIFSPKLSRLGSGCRDLHGLG